MKKVITLAAAVFLIFGAYARPVQAQVVYPGVPGAFVFTGVAPVTGAFIGSMVAFAALPAVIVLTNDSKPWSNVFPVVEQSYPHNPVSFDKYVDENGVRVSARKVSYQTPESLKYTYKDELGVHHL